MRLHRVVSPVPEAVQRAAELGVRASVLVVGPPGVGKATAVNAAAAALGVHAVPFTCHELRVRLTTVALD